MGAKWGVVGNLSWVSIILVLIRFEKAYLSNVVVELFSPQVFYEDLRRPNYNNSSLCWRTERALQSSNLIIIF
jgi:hypothetical protein